MRTTLIVIGLILCVFFIVATPDTLRRLKAFLWTALLFLLLLLTTGCTYTRVEIEHVSHPFAGPPFGPVTQEDSLNQFNYCKGKEAARWYVENCLGYKIGDGGFYGPRLTYTGRIGMKWGDRQ